MRDGFIKAAAGTLDTVVADTGHNCEEIKKRIAQADGLGVNLLALPELCVTAYSCGDLFFSQALLSSALEALEDIRLFTRGRYPLVVLGMPLRYGGKLYNCAVAVRDGHILAAVPKTHLPNYCEFYEMRHFASGGGIKDAYIKLGGETVPFGTDILLCHENMEDYCLGLEVCEDLWAPCPPGDRLCLCGATVMVNISASNETIGKAGYRRMLTQSTSARLMCGYVYANAGMGESTQDAVFSQHNIICENGAILAENPPFGGAGLTVSELDLQRLAGERQKNTSFVPLELPMRRISFSQELRTVELSRFYGKNPFVPGDAGERDQRAELILSIQANALKKRLVHTGAGAAVLGISGGLDSCLALLVTVRAFDLMGRDRRDIICVTMPCFGTTRRTRSNAEKLCEYLGVSFRTVDIGPAVELHFRDIGHDPEKHDTTYENCQARERTQVIMDIANGSGGIVVGTGDLSELALGWCTYNGDHMSMYGVNASIPKTLVRYLVGYEAGRSGSELSAVLLDILDTPVSPELLPARADGSIAQKTEDLVGPYELHDFFLYYFLRFGFSPAKIFRLAKYAFAGDYDDDTIKKWLRTFVRRFFSQQFKRSCMPDGPKVGSAALSPRGDWRMPSDASAAAWLSQLE